MIIWLITGLWILLGCAEVAHIMTMLINRSLDTYMILCSAFVFLFFCIFSGLLYWKCRIKNVRKEVSVSASTVFSPYMILFFMLAGMTIVHFVRGYVPDLQDAVYEITLNNVKSGKIMTLHPFLGVETEARMPMRMQILCLSSIYSALITLSKQTPYMILCKFVPFIVWGLSMLLYWTFSEKLFDKDIHKRWLFLAMISFIYIITSGSDGLVGQRLFYAGFSGETIRTVLLIPYTIYVSWQKKWWLTALAVVSEACLVWTTYGVGYCLLIALCMIVVHFFLDRRGSYAV